MCVPAANELRIAELAAMALAATGRKASTRSACVETARVSKGGGKEGGKGEKGRTDEDGLEGPHESDAEWDGRNLFRGRCSDERGDAEVFNGRDGRLRRSALPSPPFLQPGAKSATHQRHNPMDARIRREREPEE